MTQIEVLSIENHPYPEKGMMLVAASVELDGIKKEIREFYVPCIEI